MFVLRARDRGTNFVSLFVAKVQSSHRLTAQLYYFSFYNKLVTFILHVVFSVFEFLGDKICHKKPQDLSYKWLSHILHHSPSEQLNFLLIFLNNRTLLKPFSFFENKNNVNPWHYSSKERRPTEAFAASWQCRGTCEREKSSTQSTSS